MNENGIIFVSPSCISIFEKSIVFLFILAGVPVLNLTILIPSSFKQSDNSFAANTPSGPLSCEYSPINIFPLR